MIRASRGVAHPPERVFELLADLQRHWPLLGPALVSAELTDGTGSGGAVLTLRLWRWPARRVVTRVLASERPSLFVGDAHSGGSRARIEWRIGPRQRRRGGVRVRRPGTSGRDAAACVVSLCAVIDAAGPRDRSLAVLLRPWLRRQCRVVLKRLERELDRESVASGARVPIAWPGPLDDAVTAAEAATP